LRSRKRGHRFSRKRCTAQRYSAKTGHFASRSKFSPTLSEGCHKRSFSSPKDAARCSISNKASIGDNTSRRLAQGCRTGKASCYFTGCKSLKSAKANDTLAKANPSRDGLPREQRFTGQRDTNERFSGDGGNNSCNCNDWRHGQRSISN
jgi:hypothetical protein